MGKYWFYYFTATDADTPEDVPDGEDLNDMFSTLFAIGNNEYIPQGRYSKSELLDEFLKLANDPDTFDENDDPINRNDVYDRTNAIHVINHILSEMFYDYDVIICAY